MDKKNYGLQILRGWMCFLIVVHHFLKVDIDNNIITRIFYFVSWYVVPVFMIMTFYLNGERLKNTNDKEYLINRLHRLLIPQIGWAFIYFVCYSIVDIIFGKNLVSGLRSLIAQILTGNNAELNVSMWFQTVLIAITIMFWLIMHYRHFEYVLILLSILCLIVEYSGVYMVIYNLKYVELINVFGRFIEMIPLATIGYFLQSVKMKGNGRKNWLILGGITIIVFQLVYKWKDLIPSIIPTNNGVYPGFGYACIECILLGSMLFLSFFSLPFSKQNSVVTKLVEVVSKYTMGIYCMHRLVSKFLYLTVGFLDLAYPKNTLMDCVITYLICYFIAAMAMKNKRIRESRLKWLFV